MYSQIQKEIYLVYRSQKEVEKRLDQEIALYFDSWLGGEVWEGIS